MKSNYFITAVALFSTLCAFAQGTVFEPSEPPAVFVEIEAPLALCNPSDCITLTADFYEIKPTNSYQVKPLTYQNLFSYTGGQVIDATGDDYFSSVFNLPFKFCFYGQTYDKVVVGTNGFISFNAALASQPSGYIFNNTIPSPASPANFKNAIYGVFQDTNLATPPITNTSIQNVNYYSGGTAPNRYFVANFNRLPQFQCGGSLGDLDQDPADTDVGLSTTQIVIYETTNIIDVIVYKRIPCNSWQAGRGIIGVQNATGSAGIAAPGRNTGNWSILGTPASPSEAWRFIPNGPDPTPPLVLLEWFDQADNLLGTGEQIVVCPTENQTYKVKATYDRCGITEKIVVEDTILIEIEDPLPVLDPLDIFLCADSYPELVNINQDAYILDGASPFDWEIFYFLDPVDANNEDTGQALTPAEVNAFSIADENPVTIHVLIRDPFGFYPCFNVRSFTVQVGNPTGDFTYPEDASDTDVDTSTFCFNSNSALAPVLDPVDGLTPGGTFSVNPPTGLTIDSTTGVLDLTGATPGSYTINYDIPEDPLNPPPAGCPAFNANTIVVIESCIDATVSNSGPVCEGTGNFDLTTNYTEPVGGTTTYEWTDASGTVVSTVKSPSVTIPANDGTYVYSLVITQNGAPSTPFTTTLIVNPNPEASFLSNSTTICTGDPITIALTGTSGATVNVTDGSNNYPVLLDTTGNGEFTTPALLVDTTYTLVDATGDTDPACTASLTGSILISVGLPTATIVGFTDPVICSETGTGLEIQGTPNAIVSYTKDGVVQPDVTLSASGTFTIDTGIQSVTTTTTYDYVLTNVASTNCSDTITGESATLTVNALPVITTFSAANTTICEGTSAILNFTGTPNALVTYNDGTQDLTTTLNTIGISSVTTAPISATTTFTLVSIEVTDTVVCTNALTETVTITIDENVAIINPPTGSNTICIGDSNEFTIDATGTNLTYQWYFNGTTLIPGATNASYTLTNATAANEGDYTVIVGGDCGPDVTSLVATLVVSEETIIAPIPTPAPVCAGQPINLSVSATGTGLSYQWIQGTTPLPGETNTTLTIASATTANAGDYTVEVTNSCGTKTSNSVQVVVNELPTVTNPVGATICAGQPINLSVAVTGTGLSYQWFRGTTLLTGQTSTTLNIASATTADAGNYTIRVTGICAPPAVSAPAVIVVNEGPIFTQQPQGGTFCSGDPITLLTVATTGGTNVTYQWIKNNNPIPGATSPSYPIASSVVADSGTYFCEVTSDSCGTISSNTAVIVVNQGPAIVGQTGTEEICVGETATFTVTATGTNLTYQWYKGTVALTGAGATSDSYSIPNASETDSGEYYCIVSSTGCLSITSTPVTLLVKPLPVATIAAGSPSTICEGDSTQIIFNGTPGAVVIYTINGGTPETVLLNSSGANTIVSTGILAETTVYELVSVTYQGPDACSQNLTGSASITVNTLPTVVLEDGVICIDPVTLAVTRDYRLDTQLNEAEFTFEWFDTNGPIPFETRSYYDAQAVGQYGVTITDIITGCQSSAFANVDSSSPPTDFTYTVSGFFADNPTVVITATPPSGNYEYQLDYGPFQTSNTFDNISAGSHTITVRDTEACDVLTKDVMIIDYPKYFTPNGDGINDTWKIQEISGVSTTKIYIFDRFGKLVKELRPGGEWDGTYNGQLLPATDYWFTINYQEAGINKEFRAHFSLKR